MSAVGLLVLLVFGESRIGSVGVRATSPSCRGASMVVGEPAVLDERGVELRLSPKDETRSSGNASDVSLALAVGGVLASAIGAASAGTGAGNGAGRLASVGLRPRGGDPGGDTGRTVGQGSACFLEML